MPIFLLCVTVGLNELDFFSIDDIQAIALEETLFSSLSVSFSFGDKDASHSFSDEFADSNDSITRSLEMDESSCMSEKSFLNRSLSFSSHLSAKVWCRSKGGSQT